MAVLTVYTAPIFLALLAPLFLPEGRSLVALGAVVPGAAGLALVAGVGGGSDVRPLALLVGIAAAVTYAALVIVTKQVTARLPPPAILFWSYLVAAAFVAPLLLDATVVPQGAAVAYVLLLGVVFTAISGLLYVWLLRRVTAQAVGVLAYIEPVSAAVLAWAILGESIGWHVVLGGALVVAGGVAVVVLEPADAAAPETAPVAPG